MTTTTTTTTRGPLALLALVAALIAPHVPARAGEAEARAQGGAPPVGIVTKAPELLTSVPPVYPEEARRERRGGTVGLRLTIDSAGEVVRVDVTASAGADLDWAALGALTQFGFAPAEIDGKPAAVAIDYRLVFEVPPLEREAAREPVAKVAPPADARAPFFLSGRVRRAGTVQPIAFAEIAVSELLADEKVGPARASRTDDRGRFAFDAIPEGPYRVEVGAESYDAFVDEQYFDPGKHELDVAMVPKQANEFETVVRRQRGEPPVSRVSLSRDEVKGIPGTYGDALRVIESLPGVARAPLLGGALMVRGGYPADTAIHFEGVPIPVLYHFGGFTSVINGAFVEEIAFMPGGFPVRYGNATAGIVDVRAHELSSETFQAHFDVDDFDFGFFFGGHARPIEALPELKVGFAARRSHAEIPGSMVLAIAPTFGAPIPFLPVPLYYDYQLKLESELGPRSTVGVFLFGAEDSWAVLGDVPAIGQDAEGNDIALVDVLNSFIGNRFHRLLGSWELRPAPGLIHTIRPYVGVTRRGILSEGVAVPLLSGTSLDTPTDEVNWGLRDELSLRLAPWLRASFGFEHHGAAYDVSLLFGSDVFFDDEGLPDEIPTTTRATLSTAAIFADLQLGPMDGLSVTPGVRAELTSFAFEESEGRAIYHEGSKSVVDAWSVDPRVSLRYTVDPSTETGFALKAAFGTFHERPRGQTAAFDIDKDPLAQPVALQLIGGFEASVLDDVTLDAQVYAIRRYDLTRDRARFYQPGNLQPPPFTSLGSFDSYGSGNTLGFELMLRQRPSKYFFGWISYTFSRTEVSLGDRRESRVPFPFDQTHNLVAVGRVNLPYQITFGGRFAFVTGNPRPIADSVTTRHDLNANGYSPVLSSLQPGRLAPFHRLDLRVDKRFIFEWSSVVAFIEVINIYNYPNPEIVFPGGDYRARELRTLLPGPPLLPLIGAELDL